jgi:hypothetical protein
MASSPLTQLGASVGELEQAARDRLDDAQALLDAGRYASAIAHGLYALEIRLKLVICSRLDITNLPKVFQIHDLGALMLHSGLSIKIRDTKRPRGVAKNWDELKQLSENLDGYRYKSDPSWDERLARTVLHQLTDPTHGVLIWLANQASIKKR